MYGENNPTKRTDVREKLSKAQRNWLQTHPPNFLGKHHTEKVIQKISVANLGRKDTKETTKRRSDSHKGIKRSKHFCKQQSKRMGGKNNPSYGNHRAADHLNNHKEECPHCKIITTIGNLKRWHFDKCKVIHL